MNTDQPKFDPEALDAALRISNHATYYGELPSGPGMAEMITDCYGPTKAKAKAQIRWSSTWPTVPASVAAKPWYLRLWKSFANVTTLQEENERLTICNHELLADRARLIADLRETKAENEALQHRLHDQEVMLHSSTLKYGVPIQS